MSLHYLVKYECQKKGRRSEVCIVINDKSQAFKVWWVRPTLLHIKIQSVGERIFKIGEHLAKLQAK